MLRIFKVIFVFIGVAGLTSNAQTNIDSLWEVNKNAQNPTEKAKSLLDISYQLLFFDLDSGRAVAKKALEYSKRHELAHYEGEALIHIGRSFAWNASFDTAAIYYERSIEVFKKANDYRGLSNVFINYGGIYYDQGDFVKTIDYWEQSLQITEALNDSAGIATNSNNIGEVYAYMNDFEHAIPYFERCLIIDSLIGDKKGLAYANLNMGEIALWYKDYDEAFKKFNRSARLFGEMNMLRPLAGSYASIASVYLEKGDVNAALSMYLRSKQFWEESKDFWGISEVNTEIANVYFKMGKIDSAIWHGEKSQEIAFRVNAGPLIVRSSEILARAYDQKGNLPLAFQNLKRYTTYKDSIFNSNNKEDIVRLGMQHQFEKESYLDSISNAQKMKMSEMTYLKQIEDQERQKKYSIVFIVVVLIIAILFFRAYRIRTKSSKIIEEKKHEVEEKNALLEQKNQDILAGIQYSKRIQHSILPETNKFKSQFKDVSVLYLPKDIIGGDFYWAQETDDYFYWSVIDCTGHGVPGALVSMVAYNALNYVVMELKKERPADILDELSRIIEKEFTKDGHTGKDGMDLALCRIEKSTNQLTFAGAMNNVLICRGDEKIELKADRQPVGYFEKRKPFTQHEFQLFSNDRLYMFTDGYADQFGGLKGKKLKYTQFLQLILGIQQMSLQDQSKELKAHFQNWRGDIEQIDDVCVLGVEL
ncbi:MAG: tetratricopeptide repeat protein [Crocinitomicaceae bacterium]|nr:tetratricopeptide repeat protein [Crocinitomicaceae bacterium]